MGYELYAYIAAMVISAYVSYKNRPKSVTPKPTAFEDFEFPQCEEGTPQCVIFGDCWTEDWTVGGLGNFRTRPIKTKGGKK